MALDLHARAEELPITELQGVARTWWKPSSVGRQRLV